MDSEPEYKNIYYKIVFEMPRYTDSYIVYGIADAMIKYDWCIAENKKDSGYYKDVRIVRVTETRKSETCFPLY